MIQISRKSIRLRMAALHSRLREFSAYDFSCNTSRLYKENTDLVFSTGSVGNRERRSVRTGIVNGIFTLKIAHADTWVKTVKTPQNSAFVRVLSQHVIESGLGSRKSATCKSHISSLFCRGEQLFRADNLESCFHKLDFPFRGHAKTRPFRSQVF